MKKKVLASIAAGLVIIGGVVTPVFGLAVAFAQQQPVVGPQTQQQANANAFNPVQAPNTFTNPQGGANQPNNIGTKPQDFCAGNGDTFVCPLMAGISEVIMFVPTALATISGMVFDYSIWNSIQSGTYTQYDGADGNDGLVVSGWKLVRDFTNLLFIFALFVIAFTLILDLDGGAKVSMTSNPKRTLARVLMMALLVNFSFFLCRAVIDTTNKFALQFYSNMNKAPVAALSVSSDAAQNTSVQEYYKNQPAIHSIATGIISMINPQQFLLDKNGAAAKAGPGQYSNLFLLSFVAAAFGLFLVYIFLSVAILFIGRTIGLYLAVIISPLAFVSYTIPALQRQPYIGFDDWLKQFLGLAFMAPIFLFFIYIGIQFFTIPSAAGSGTIGVAAQVAFKFAIVAMFFTLAKKISKDMSGKIGDMATGMVTGAVTSIATIGAAAATGGASAAFVATRQQAAQGLTSMSNRVLGEERTDAIRQRMGGLKNFGSLRNNPGAALAGLGGAITGSKVPGKINSAITEGQGLGAKINRVNNIKNIREERLANEAAAAKKKIDDAQKAKEAAEAEAKKQATRTTYNYDQRKATMDAKNAQPGPKPTFGDGSAKMKDSDFSAKQQERILNKAIAAEAKRGGGQPVTTPVTATTTTTSATAETPTKATNTFTGDGKFDRPAETKPSGLVDTNGQPLTKESLDANQKLESARLARLYENAEREKKNTVHVDNLAVKNLKVEPSVPLPSRQSNANMTPQKQATTLLSGIQMTPRASSGAMNYKSSDFATKKPQQDTLDPMVQQLADTKKEEIKKLESDKKEYHDFLKEQGPLDAKGANVATSVLGDYKDKIQKGYADLKDIKATSVSGALDQSGIVRDNLPGENGNFDLGGMGPREEHEE